MAEDLEVGVLLKPKNNLEDEVQDQEMALGGQAGGDLTPGQREQQEGTIAGGVSRGLAGAAVLAGVLSQLKSITGLFEAVFGFLSRALLPAVEVVAELIRPLVSGINDFISDPTGVVRGAERTLGIGQTAQQEGRRGPLTGIGGTISEEQAEDIGPGGNPFPAISLLIEGLTNPSQSADQTGEVTKNKLKNAVDDAQRDKTGSFR